METGSPDDPGTAGATRAADRAGPADQAAPVPPAGPADQSGPAGPADQAGPAREEPVWTGLPPGLLRMRRLLLVVWLGLLTLAAGVLPALFLAPSWAALALLPLALLAWGWVMLGRNWRSWRYAERADDLLISRGVLWQEETVVPYGRMQLVEVASGPVERHFGLASVQLHTAAAATDATIPGLDPAEAERLRDRLTELGEARSAGL
ncbi:PH domain-containing protein [Streptomyces tendae]|uniref:PH domain-containing protein n=1 Tax=Streptomyces tendae TaxID=1932 RepID=UPI00249292A3|nr:PH domain-containing protein [Streptomyces tendae]